MYTEDEPDLVDTEDPLPGEDDEYDGEIDWNSADMEAFYAHLDNVETEPTPPPAASNANSLSLEEKKQDFMKHCQHQVNSKSKGWDINKTLPWRRNDELEKKIIQLGMTKKQAASCWLQLRRSYGSLEKIQVSGACDHFYQMCQSYIKDGRLAIINEALELAKTKLSKAFTTKLYLNQEKAMLEMFDDDDDEECGTLVVLVPLLANRIENYNRLLAKHFIGMSIEKKDESLARFHRTVVQTRASEFLPSCVSEFSFVVRDAAVLRRILNRIDVELLQVWNACLIDKVKKDVVKEVDEDGLENILLNSGGVIYYVAGWMLFRLTKVRGKAMEPAKDLANFNRVSVSDTAVLSTLPTKTVDTREVHEGKMMRVSPKFFRFVQIVEAIFTSNLNDNDIVWSHKGHIFQSIKDGTSSSAQVKKVFEDCLPSTVNEKEATATLEFLLTKCASMRARGYLKKLKNKKLATTGTTDNLALRPAMLSASQHAKGAVHGALAK